MLLNEHEEYHGLGPKDILKPGKAPVMHVDVVRTTSHTGEQFHINCPVYEDDTREELKTRIWTYLSIIQERLEDENEAMERVNRLSQQERLREESIRRNQSKFKTDKKDIIKRARAEGWTKEQVDSAMESLTVKFETAQKTLLEGNPEIQ